MRLARLAATKEILNRVTPVLLKAVPGVGPRRPVSKLTVRLFQLLRKALAMHPDRFYEDGNFPRILQAVERTLLFLAEEDGHYAGWLAQAMLLVHDLVEESRSRFPPGQAGDVLWISWACQHGIREVKAAA